MNMKTKLKTPRGWRRIRHGEMRRLGDKVWAHNEGPWTRTELVDVEFDSTHHHPLIRRRPLPRKAKKGKRTTK